MSPMTKVSGAAALTMESGGIPAANAAAARDSWPEILRFLGQVTEQGSGPGTSREPAPRSPGPQVFSLSGLQLREVLLGELAGHPAGGVLRGPQLRLPRPQLDAADLARDGLRQLGELQAPDALVGRQMLTAVAQDRERCGSVRQVTGGKRYVGLGHGQPDRVGGWHHGRLRHRLVLDQ